MAPHSPAPGGAAAPSEHVIQREIVQAIEREGWAVFAIPNGGRRNVVTAMKLQAEGVRAGVPDLFVPALRLWLETKKPKKGRLSKPQVAWRDYLRAAGYDWAEVRSIEEALSAVRTATLYAGDCLILQGSLP